MKRKFISLDDETIITKENVQIIGEKIAVCAIKHAQRFAYGTLDSLYKGLLRDISYNLTLEQHFSDGYDIAQEAICYLCNFFGHKLGEICIPNIHKKLDSIRMGCFKHLYNYLRKQKKHIQTEENLDDYIYMNLEKYKKYNETPSYNAVDKIINNLNLTEQERMIAFYISSGVPLVKIAEFINLSLRTIRRRKVQIIQKYMQIYG